MDCLSKLSYLDYLLLNSNIKLKHSQILYESFLNDILINLNIYFLLFSSIFQSEYQEILSSVILIIPELILVFNEYYNIYYMAIIINKLPSPVFDTYVNNLNFYYSEGIIYFFLFFIFIFFIIYFFTIIISFK